MAALSFSQLRDSVRGDHVALRGRLTLAPAGGDGDKVFPPTYGVPDSAVHRYAVEQRRVDGVEVTSVLLDSVASQANRMELALLDGLEAKELSFPNPYVDFTVDPELMDLGQLSALEAPHRLADAIFRDSLLDGTLFRLSKPGRAITEARPAAATALFHYSPAALVFGMWDSTGPKGGLGSKFQRALVSEIVGHEAVIGTKVGSRIDPLSIQLGVDIYEHADPDQEWTLDPEEAAKDGKVPRLFARAGGSGKKGRPSKINHSNIAPMIDSKAGGVTISHAVQTTVLSLAALRRLRFPVRIDGSRIEAGARRDAEVAARTALAALGVAAVAYQVEFDYDLRSRCLLIPTQPLELELVPRDGSTPTPAQIDRAGATAVLSEAAAALEAHGLAWETESLRLEPAPKLCHLVRRSRALARTTDEDS